MKSNLMKHTAIMTAVNLLMRFISIKFNAYLTEKAGMSGIGLFQLIMSVYSLAVTFSCAGIRLATTRITVKSHTLGKLDTGKSLSLCLTYAGICGCFIGFVLLCFSEFISIRWIENTQTEFPLKILSLSLPFVAMSSSLGGYFTAVECVPQYSCVQFVEQIFKILVIIFIMDRVNINSPLYSCTAIVVGMTASEIFSFIVSLILKSQKSPNKSNNNSVRLFEIFKIAIPDAFGTCFRSVLLTYEHLLIPKCLKKSGVDSVGSLSAYGCIHGLSFPVLLYPSAVLSSLSSLLIPSLAKMYEYGDYKGIKASVSRTLKRTVVFSLVCSVFYFIFSTPIAEIFCKSTEAAKYLKILSPLVPVMYTDIVTDGMLKGLDRHVDSMKFNIFDSAISIVLVKILLPLYSVKGYIATLYITEIINFLLSINLLRKVCDIRCFQEHEEENSRFFRLKKYSVFPKVCEYQTYPDRKKRSQAP